MASQPIPIPGAQSLQTLVQDLRDKTHPSSPRDEAQFNREKTAFLQELDGVPAVPGVPAMPGRAVREQDRSVIRRLLNF
jgi:hypothetical protein